jgi:hypothetical protein
MRRQIPLQAGIDALERGQFLQIDEPASSQQD